MSWINKEEGEERGEWRVGVHQDLRMKRWESQFHSTDCLDRLELDQNSDVMVGCSVSVAGHQ